MVLNTNATTSSENIRYHTVQVLDNSTDGVIRVFWKTFACKIIYMCDMNQCILLQKMDLQEVDCNARAN